MNRSTTPKRSRNTYLQVLIAACLQQDAQKTMSIEELASVWSILREPQDIGKALSSDASAQEWTTAYPDAIKPNENLFHVLGHMIDRREISVSNSGQVTLIEDIYVYDDAVMDAHYAHAAIRAIKRQTTTKESQK